MRDLFTLFDTRVIMASEPFFFLTWIDHLPWDFLLVAAVLLAFAPFFPEPHLWQKLKMLATGTLSKPLDIFDLFIHATPLLLVIIKGIRFLTQQNP